MVTDGMFQLPYVFTRKTEPRQYSNPPTTYQDYKFYRVRPDGNTSSTTLANLQTSQHADELYIDTIEVTNPKNRGLGLGKEMTRIAVQESKDSGLGGKLGLYSTPTEGSPSTIIHHKNLFRLKNTAESKKLSKAIEKSHESKFRTIGGLMSLHDSNSIAYYLKLAPKSEQVASKPQASSAGSASNSNPTPQPKSTGRWSPVSLLPTGEEVAHYTDPNGTRTGPYYTRNYEPVSDTDDENWSKHKEPGAWKRNGQYHYPKSWTQDGNPVW